MNKITQRYFDYQGVSPAREEEILAEIAAETGFIVDKEISRGVIYDKDKVGSIIYSGMWYRRPSVLKIQLLKLRIDEGKIIDHLFHNRRNKLVRPPKLYRYSFWNESHGYGYTIMEKIEAPKIFEMPSATAEQMADFCRFYGAYRTSLFSATWIHPTWMVECRIKNAWDYTKPRVENWKNICQSKGRLEEQDYLPFYQEFMALGPEIFSGLTVIFSHGHLTANDIHKMPDGSYVLTSNLLWGYRPQWYDLAFNVWSCLLHIRDTKYTFEKMLEYINQWLAHYRQIPLIQKDKGFEKKILANLLERVIGSILADLGANDLFAKKENVKYQHHLLDLHQRLFKHLVSMLK